MESSCALLVVALAVACANLAISLGIAVALRRGRIATVATLRDHIDVRHASITAAPHGPVR